MAAPVWTDENGLRMSQVKNRVRDRWYEHSRNAVSVTFKNRAFPELRLCERFDGRWTMYDGGEISAQGSLS